MMELRQLESFRKVAQLQSFTRAAVHLDRAQSSVTGQVRSLERSLGVTLFERRGRTMRLTESGERLCEYADRILGLVEEARSAVRPDRLPSGKLSVGTMESLTSYRLIEPLLALQDRYPRLRLSVRANLCSDISDGVRQGRYDAGFLMSAETHHPDLAVVVLLEEPLVVLAGPEHPLVRAPEVTLEDLRGQRIGVTESGCSYHDQFENLLTDGSTGPVQLFEFGTIEAIKRTLAPGRMIALLPAVAVEAEVRAGTLTVLPYDAPFKVSTQLVWHKDRWVTPTLAAFIDFMSRRLKQQAGRQLAAATGWRPAAPSRPAGQHGG